MNFVFLILTLIIIIKQTWKKDLVHIAEDLEKTFQGFE
jgi:hypothetical protein